MALLRLGRAAQRKQGGEMICDCLKSADAGGTIEFIEYMPPFLAGAHNPFAFEHLKMPGDHGAVLWKLFSDGANIRSPLSDQDRYNFNASRFAQSPKELCIENAGNFVGSIFAGRVGVVDCGRMRCHNLCLYAH